MATRAPPEAPPSNSYFVRVYRKTNLRPVVLVVAVLTAFWALFSAIGNFRSAGYAKGNVPKLASFLLALGAIHSAITAVECFGVFAAITQRLALVKIYAYLTIVTAIGMAGGALLRVIVHYTQKGDILKQCGNLTEGRTGLVYPFGYFGPVYREFIDKEEAERWCNYIYNRDSVSEIISLLIILVVAAVFVSLTFAYYRQVADPSSVVNFSRTPQTAHFAPSHYNPAYGYNASVPNLGYGYNAGPPPGFQGGFAPPSGPPPPQQRDAPSYTPGADGTAGATYTKREDDDPFADFEDTTKRTNGPK